MGKRGRSQRLSNADIARMALGLSEDIDKAVAEREAAHELQDRLKALHQKPSVKQPEAPPPPRFTPETWSLTCWKRDHRCRSCELCTWEHKVELRLHEEGTYAPDLHALTVFYEHRHLFRNLDAALVAFVEWEGHGRWSPSAQGTLQDRLQQGLEFAQPGTTYRRDREDPFLRRATDLVEVSRAVKEAFTGNPWGLENTECIAMLVMRVGRKKEPLPGYDAMQERFKLQAETCKNVVRYGRHRITVELAARGVIPMPKAAAGMHHDIDVRMRALQERRSA